MTLALVAVGIVRAGDRKLYVVGGQQLDRDFLSTLVLPAGMRVLLYRKLAPQFSASELLGGRPGDVARLRPLIESVDRRGRESRDTVGSGADAETFHALPLQGYREQPARRPADGQLAPRPGASWNRRCGTSESRWRRPASCSGSG